MKKSYFYVALLAVMSMILVTSCGNDDEEKVDVQVSFKSLTANGSATGTTTALTLTLDKAVDGLTADDLTLTAGETGATKGSLTDKGSGVYELALTGVAKAGEVTVTVSKAGCEFTPASQKVNVFYAGVVKQVAFSSLTVNGSATETTVALILTLTFDKAVDGLAVADLTLTGGETGAKKGALTSKGDGVYELSMTGVVKSGEVTVTVSKEGYEFTPASQKVNVLYTKAVKQVAFSSLVANGSSTETTTALTLTFDKAIDGLTAGNLTLTEGETGALIVALENKGNGVYELGLTGIAKSGEVTLAVAKEGYKFTPASQKVNIYLPTIITNKALIAKIEAAESVTFDKNADGDVDASTVANKEKIEDIVDLNLTAKGLASLEGIEYFTNLNILLCDQNALTTLDVTKNIKLTILDCSANKLTSLDVTNNVALKGLGCKNNRLTTLDVTKNTELIELYCNGNRLSTVDISLSKISIKSKAYLGEQTADGTTQQGITVTLTQTQKDSMTDDWLTNSNYHNTGVTLNVKP